MPPAIPPASDKFSNVPQDADTRIKAQRQITINGMDALHQRWVWDGIAGESLVFCASDVCAASDQEIIAMARDAGLAVMQADCTVTRDESGFVFLNFGFEY